MPVDLYVYLGNDQCASCNSTIMDKVTADAYGGYVEAAIERIKSEIPKTVVNLRKFSFSINQVICLHINL